MKIQESENSAEKIVVIQDTSKTIIYNFCKRGIDIIISVFGILILVPFFLLLYILLKCSDPKSNVIFTQKRVGKNNSVFNIYKFRTMYSDAEARLKDLLELNEIDGAMFKMKDDPRITKIGKYLRKYSIDELPQLVNVLKGEMSLVGPRPPLIREVENYSTYDKQRLLVKPGITGLWQVSGRNSLSFNQMVELDIKYIETPSMKKDVEILVRTIKVVILKENAY